MSEYHVLNEITVDSQALIANYRYFQSRNPGVAIAPVLKSNAYGHGLTQVGKFVDQVVKPPLICVDSLYEAYELYKAGVKTEILVMGYTDPRNFAISKKLPFSFSVFDLETAAALSRHQPGARIHLKLDTGMTRLGVTPEELPKLLKGLKSFPNLQVEGVFSHLAVADEPGKITQTKRQVRRYQQMLGVIEAAGYHPQWRHLSATAGAEVIHDPTFNLIRLGIGFYGYSPFGPHTKEGRRERKSLQPALTLTTHAAMVKTIEKGTAIGYGGTYQAKQKETIAVLPLGYNEGIPRGLSNRGAFFLGSGTPCPIVGRVSMNMTTVKIPRGVRVKAGTSFHFGSVYEEANLTETIPYTILIGFHPSLRRHLV